MNPLCFFTVFITTTFVDPGPRHRVRGTHPEGWWEHYPPSPFFSPKVPSPLDGGGSSPETESGWGGILSVAHEPP